MVSSNTAKSNSHATLIPPNTVALQKTDSYEQFAALLTSLLILASFSTLVLFGLWLSTGLIKKKASTAVQLETLGDLGGLGDNRRLDPDVTIPGEEIEFDEPTFSEAIEQVTETIASQIALFTNPAEKKDSVLTVGEKHGDGSAPGQGAGRLGHGRHWEVQFHDQRSLQAYARQLDYFAIELAILQPGGNVMYFSNLAQAAPTVRQELAAGEQRYYLTWLRPELQATDRELILKSNVRIAENQIILKFISPELEQYLVQLERDAAGTRLSQLRATYFGIRQNGQNYEVYVIRQTFGN